MGVFLLTCAVLFNAVANGLFKAGADMQEMSLRKAAFIGLGLVVGLANTICYIKALEKTDLGIAYAIFSAGSIILIAAISLLFFKEGISVQKALGLIVICVGMLITWKS